MNTYTKTCLFCGKTFKALRSDARYCTDNGGKCRSKAQSKRIGRAVDNRALAMARGNETKAAQVHKRVCIECGKPFEVSGKQGKRQYCGDACKRRHAYRAKTPGLLSLDMKSTDRAGQRS